MKQINTEIMEQILFIFYIVSIYIARKYNILSNRIDRTNEIKPIIWFIPFGFVAYYLYYLSQREFKFLKP